MNLAESLKASVIPGNLPVLAPAAADSSQPGLPAKAVSLQVRPFMASHLCFDTDGVLGFLNLTLNPNRGLLGATVPAFNFDLFHAILGSRPTVPASGNITFTTNPAADTTIVMNGTQWTFVSSLTTGNQLLIGPTLDLTLASAVTTLQASNDENTKKFTYASTVTVLILTAATGGSRGNALTISTTVSGASASGSTLSGGDSSRLLYDFLKIQADVAPFTLAALRAEPRKATLEKAISLRQNAYLTKYAKQDTIISFARQYYFNPPDFGLKGPANPDSKTARLSSLNNINEGRWQVLNDAYANAGRAAEAEGVVDAVISTLSSDTSGFGYAANSQTDETLIVTPTGSSNTLGALQPNAPPKPWDTPQGPGPYSAAAPSSAASLWGASTWAAIGQTSGTSASGEVGSSYQTNSNASQAHVDQQVQTYSQAFRHPFYDELAKYQRAQISLIDQRFAALQASQNIPDLATIFGNERVSIDADVYQLQIAYLNTILMSPIPGVVTGVYKNLGDPVRAGEPVLRVEYSDVVLIEAIVIFRGPIVVNQTTVTITTALFGSSAGKPTSISGYVVAARSHDGDDTWHLIVECLNQDGSSPPNPIVPSGYRFDPDDTSVTIV
ncbi:hypothetical protein [Paraburkholderia sp. MM5477-R1]|uniref:hypothetical protein n=1 Tax=Paraburkholderia sp. MM5477-R1 TaxID=2991062 RepID=UPI003D21FC46